MYLEFRNLENIVSGKWETTEVYLHRTISHNY